MTRLISALMFAFALASVTPVAAQSYHTYPHSVIPGTVDHSYMAGQHAKVVAGTARQHERHEAYLAAHPDHVIYRLGPDHHAERMAKHYDALMARCRTGEAYACREAGGFRPALSGQ